MKYFRWSEEFIYHGISYTNLLMYMATIPDYSLDDKETKTEKEAKREEEEIIATKETLSWFGDA